MTTETARGRGKSERSLALIAEAKDILAAIHPASVRAVCYQLFNRHVIASMAKSETNRVSVQLTDARELPSRDPYHIPWHWIVDETREPERVSACDDLDGYLDTVKGAYRRDRWTYQPTRVEVWSEKGTVRGTLTPVLREYGVTFRALHGFSSATVLHEAADESLRMEQDMVVLYIGDWDPSGLRMGERDIPERLERYDARIQFQRIALTQRHCQQLGPRPSFLATTKKLDRNYRWFVDNYGERCWELDALDPVRLRGVVERAIRKHIDWTVWQREGSTEQAELDSIRQVVGAWPGISMPASKWSP